MCHHRYINRNADTTITTIINVVVTVNMTNTNVIAHEFTIAVKININMKIIVTALVNTAKIKHNNNNIS